MSFTAGGTPRWMSPELLDPDRFGITDYRPTKQSDCYALGMVVYEVRGCDRSHFHDGSTYISSGSLRKRSLLGDHEWISSDDRYHER